MRAAQRPTDAGLSEDETVAGMVQDKTSDDEQNGIPSSTNEDIEVLHTSPDDTIGHEKEKTVSKPETKGQMQQRHKRESKALKDQVKRMGKKGKDEASKMLKQMEERHAAELSALEVQADVVAAEISELSFYPLSDAGSAREKKKTKAQKRREKLEQEELERERRIAEEIEAMGETDRQIEEDALLQKLQVNGLKVKEIPADGHCLYRSIEDQLCNLPDQGDSIAQDVGGDITYNSLRRICAEYIRSNRNEFINFLSEDDLDAAGSQDEAFEAYCERVENTAAWGGHLELEALSKALHVRIKVHGANMETIDVGSEFERVLDVCYLLHYTSLGNHYNSCSPL
jgi:OTU domain-containing protein 6